MNDTLIGYARCSYSVTAKDFGYQSQTISGVQVTNGQPWPE